MQIESTEPAQVLVIDDNDVSRTSIRRLLERAGLSVIAASSPLGASRIIVQRHVKVAVVDLEMPEMRGSALVELIRKNRRIHQVGVVIISGVSDPELVKAAAESGADAAISKLDMVDTLVPTVNRLLRKVERADSAAD